MRTPVLDIACEIAGADDAPAVVLVHGFPYDPRCFDAVVPLLTAKGLRVVVPYVRGLGPTRFLSADTMRSGRAPSANPDFADVSVHSYRHRYGYAAGDPRHAEIEARLAKQPKIAVPAIAPHGEFDEVIPLHTSYGHAKHLTGRHERRVLPVGNNPPQEARAAFAQAILDLHR